MEGVIKHIDLHVQHANPSKVTAELYFQRQNHWFPDSGVRESRDSTHFVLQRLSRKFNTTGVIQPAVC